MKRKYGRKIRIGLLACVLTLLFLPQAVGAAPSPPITSVEISVEVPKIGNQPDRYPRLAPGNYTFQDCRWFEGSDDSGATFIGMNSGVFKSGKYYGFQSTLIATGDNTFSDSVTATINGVPVPVMKNDSKTIVVNRVFGLLWEPMSFIDSTSFDIPAGQAGTPIKSYQVYSVVAGGYPPYHFELFSGPSWIKVSSDGKVSGTRPATAQKATTAEIRVVDDDATACSVIINVGAVTAKPQTTDKTTAGTDQGKDKTSDKKTDQTDDKKTDKTEDPDEDDSEGKDKNPVIDKSEDGKSDRDSEVTKESSNSGSRLGLILGITGIGLGVVLLVLVLLKLKARR